MALIIALLTVPAHALSFKLDFTQDGTFETSYDMSPGRTVKVDIWMVDWPTKRPNVAAIDFYFKWDTAELAVNQVIYNHLKKENGGTWDDAAANLLSPGNYKLGVIEFGAGVQGSKFKLHTIELQYKGETATPQIDITVTLDSKAVIDVNGDGSSDIVKAEATVN